MTEPLAIVAVGLATSVGSSAAATAVALRAGIARFSEDPTASSPTHAVTARSPLCHGSRGAERAASLVRAALADASYAAVPAAAVGVLGASVAGAEAPPVPYPTRWEAASDVLERHTALDVLTSPSAPWPLAVVAADSLVTPAALARIAGAGRLKAAGTAGGFVPGEAAVALVVEPLAHARLVGRPALAVITSDGRGHETVPLGGAAPSVASGLTDALAQALPDGSPPPDLVVVDLNGERARAAEWALAAPRALPYAADSPPLWAPADGVGDVGAAHGLLLVGLAALAGPTRTLAVASDDVGARRALVLGSPSSVS